jgi:hypothetical protein
MATTHSETPTESSERTSGVRAWPAGPSVEDVLADREPRVVSLEAENNALQQLARALARADGDVLQQLVELALDLCKAHSAGVSIIEFDGPEKVFRWRAVAGRWSNYLMGSMPRALSPCGVVVDRNAAQVMPQPHLYFPAMGAAVPLATEALLTPFEAMGETVGTVWVVAHDESLTFSVDHLRIIRALAPFAAAAYVTQSTLRKSLADRDELMRTLDRMHRESERRSGHTSPA